MDFFPVSPGPFLPDIAIDRKSKDDLSLNLDLENFPENIFDKQEPEKFIEPTKVCLTTCVICDVYLFFMKIK